MRKKEIFRGAATALITPFIDGEIDYKALGELIEMQIAEGIDALVIGGTTAEAATLSDGERYKLYSFAKADIKSYRPETNSLGSGQVLCSGYTAEKAKLVTWEMTDLLVLDLVDKNLVTDQMVLTVGYDIDNLLDPERRKRYRGAVVTDHYGRKVPKHAHGTVNLPGYTSSTREITEAVMELFDRIVDADLLVRRVNIVACHVLREQDAPRAESMEQLDLFAPMEDAENREQQRQRERRRQQAVIGIQKKYGKNAILKGMNLEEGATAISRNQQIGGHKA